MEPRKLTIDRRQAGFSLLECVIAMVILVVGVLGVEMLVVSSLGLQTFSRNASTENALARGKVEELSARAAADAARANGGSLTSNVAGYFDMPVSNVVRRWKLSAGACGTQNVIVRVMSSDPNITLPSVQIETLIE